MFNLLVGMPNGGALPRNRMLEGTSSHVQEFLGVADGNFNRLLDLPTLAMPEVGPHGSSDVARVGTLSRITPSGANVLLEFTPNPHILPIPVNEILANREAFDVEREWGFHRTRLTVKEIDLYRTLLELGQSREVVRPSRRYLNFPETPVDPGLVVVMMPFRAEFEPVWQAIQSVVYDAGLDCERADSIWDKDSIMDDIVGLLWRAQIVITDYTGHNANVFYETGIAHALGKHCIPLAQPADEIPFDLRHLRTLMYEASEIGLKRLKLKLGDRIQKILQQN